MSNDILISEEEKSHFFMGEDAFERADLERKIVALERALDEKDRLLEAGIRQVRKEAELQVAAARERREHAVRQLDTVYGQFVDPTKLEAEDKDGEILRLQTALANAKMMIDFMHYTGTGYASTEVNNLVCAIREWATIPIDCSMDNCEAQQLKEQLRELQFAHLRDMFQPHKTYTGAWTKDVDPSMFPMRFLLDAATKEDTVECGNKEICND